MKLSKAFTLIEVVVVVLIVMVLVTVSFQKFKYVRLNINNQEAETHLLSLYSAAMVSANDTGFGIKQDNPYDSKNSFFSKRRLFSSRYCRAQSLWNPNA